MDYSRPTRIVKLSGLPEVLHRGDRSARIIDATARPSTTSVHQRARPIPTPAGLANYKSSSASLSPPLIRQRSQPSFRPQPQPRHQQATNYPQSIFGQSTATTATTTTSRRRSADIDHSNHTDYLHQHSNHQNHHQQKPQNQQQPHQNHQQAKHQITTSRSCTPNILHQANKFSSPEKQTQRRAVSLSPTNQYSHQLAEIIQAFKQLTERFETFVTKSEHEKSNLSDSSRPSINQDRKSPNPSPSYQQHSQTHSTQTNTFSQPQHHHNSHQQQQQAPPPVAPPPVHQQYPYHQHNRPRQQQFYQQHPSVIYEEEQQYLLGPKQWCPSSVVPPQPQPRHHLLNKCYGHCNCYNCLGYHTKQYPQYPATRVAKAAAPLPTTTTNCIDSDDDGPANLSMASREYLSRYNLA